MWGTLYFLESFKVSCSSQMAMDCSEAPPFCIPSKRLFYPKLTLFHFYICPYICSATCAWQQYPNNNLFQWHIPRNCFNYALRSVGRWFLAYFRSNWTFSPEPILPVIPYIEDAYKCFCKKGAYTTADSWNGNDSGHQILINFFYMVFKGLRDSNVLRPVNILL